MTAFFDRVLSGIAAMTGTVDFYHYSSLPAKINFIWQELQEKRTHLFPRNIQKSTQNRIIR
jgi:hypothetical protein